MKKYFLGFISGILLISASQIALAVVNPNYAAEKFSDVPSSDWYTSALTDMVVANIVNGYPDGTFKPGNSVNRAEAVVLLDNMRAKIHENMDEVRFVVCYGTNEEPNEQLSQEDQEKFTKIRGNFCGQAKHTLIPGYTW